MPLELSHPDTVFNTARSGCRYRFTSDRVRCLWSSESHRCDSLFFSSGIFVSRRAMNSLIRSDALAFPWNVHPGGSCLVDVCSRTTVGAAIADVVRRAMRSHRMGSACWRLTLCHMVVSMCAPQLVASVLTSPRLWNDERKGRGKKNREVTVSPYLLDIRDIP